MRQKTLRRPIEASGIGLHTGKLVHLRIEPAPAFSGIVFVRADQGSKEVPALAQYVVRQELAMAVSRDGASVATIEHLLAAFVGVGIDNARVILSGPEVPVFDGSSRTFLHLLDEAGRKELAAPRSTLVVRKTVRVQVEGAEGTPERFAEIGPADSTGLELDYEIDFKHALLGRQHITLDVTEASFREELATARTFCFMKDVEAMHARGLALGGSLENAVVIGDAGFLNAPRMKDEFVRHKALDAVGDLALSGFLSIRGRFVGRCAGHALHAQLVQALLRDHDAWSVEVAHDAGVFSERYAATA